MHANAKETSLFEIIPFPVLLHLDHLRHHKSKIKKEALLSQLPTLLGSVAIQEFLDLAIFRTTLLLN